MGEVSEERLIAEDVLAAILAYDPQDDPTDLLSRAYNEIESLRTPVSTGTRGDCREHGNEIGECSWCGSLPMPRPARYDG